MQTLAVHAIFLLLGVLLSLPPFSLVAHRACASRRVAAGGGLAHSQDGLVVLPR